jgi:hypothetical protein
MKHETKNCPRCNRGFECKVGDIANCQCTQITLSIEEIAFIEEQYDECLCMNCIHELKRRYVHFVNKYLLREN